MTAATFEDVRALIGLFRRSDLRDLSVRAGGWTVFVAREGGGRDPLEIRPQVAAETIAIVAPHLGIFTAACATGGRIAAGQRIGSIAVLGEDRPVVATVVGVVDAIEVPDGDLVEFGTPLLRVVAD